MSIRPLVIVRMDLITILPAVEISGFARPIMISIVITQEDFTETIEKGREVSESEIWLVGGLVMGWVGQQLRAGEFWPVSISVGEGKACTRASESLFP